MTPPNILNTIRTHLASQYDVQGEAGEGGMATVFRALDRKHGRDVAIKVLKPELAASIGRDRFLQEITIAARLQHPNVLPVYDSGEVDGVLYYVMPFVEGESLKERIDRGGIEPKEALRIVREVASALDYAHRENVVHRDIKPANILLSQGHAVVADFGIARAASHPGQTQTPGMTQVGTSVGTPWYMSPEQATADPNIDGRSDIFSLGCVLFELLEGGTPFNGESVQTIITQIIATPTPDLTQASVAGPVKAALRRALEKNPDDRFATAGEFEQALEVGIDGVDTSATTRNRLILSGAAAAVILAFVGGFLLRSSGDTDVLSEAQVIAVLPFAVSGANDELGEGMVSLLSTNLNAIGQLRMVDSRTILQRWRGRGGEEGLDLETSLEVGRDVGAGSVLLGNIVSLGANVRITADLYSVDGEQLANVQLDGSADSALMLIDSLSLGILQNIWRSNSPLPSFDVAAITSSSIDAIRAYMRGALHFKVGAWDSARVAFLAATDADTTFALAHLALSEAYGWTGQHGSDVQKQSIARASAHADRLPPRERLLVAGYELNRNGDLTSIDSLELYTRRYPSDAKGWYALGDFRYHDRGRLTLDVEEQLEAFDRAIELDSSYTAALIHPMEIALLHGTEESFNRYRDLAGNAVDQDYGPVAQIVWGTPAEQEEAILALVQSSALPTAIGAALIANPSAIDMTIEAAQEALSDLPLNQAVNLQYGLGTVAMASGRLEVLDEIVIGFEEHEEPGMRPLGSLLRILAFLGGVQDFDYARPGLVWFAENQPGPGASLIGGIIALANDDVETLERHIQTLEAMESTSRRLAALGALKGWAALNAGDTATAITLLTAAVDSLPTPTRGGSQVNNSFKFVLARALAADPDTRERGIKMLRWGISVQNAPEMLPARHLAIADALQNAGDVSGAIAALSDFIALMEGASAELQPRVQDARERLAALQERNR